MNQLNISNAQYISWHEGVNASIKATIDGVKMFIPLDPNNKHYAEIMRQVEDGTLVIKSAEGNTPEPADPVEVV